MFDFQVELKRLEDLSESIVQDFAHMRQREVSVCNTLHLEKKRKHRNIQGDFFNWDPPKNHKFFSVSKF